MSLQNNPRPFSSQNDASVCPTGGAFPIFFPPGAQPATVSYKPLDRPSGDAPSLFFTQPVPIPWQTSQDDQRWMPGQPIMMSMKERALNTGIGMAPLYPLSRSNPRAIHDNHHPAGVSLGMNTVEHK